MTRIRAMFGPTIDALRSLREIDRRRIKRLIVLVVGSTGLDTLSVLLFVPLLASIQGSTESGAYRWLSRTLGASDIQAATQRIALLVAAVFIAKTLVGLGLSRVQAAQLAEAEAHLRARTLAGYFRRPWGALRRIPSAEIANMCSMQTTVVFESSITPSLLLLSDALGTIGMVTPLLVLYPLAALLILLYCAGLAILYAGVVLPRAGRVARVLHDAEIQSSRFLLGVAGAMKPLYLSGRSAQVIDQFRSEALGVASSRARQRFTLSLPRYYFEATITIGFLLLVALLARTSDRDALTAIGLFGAVAFRLTPALTRVLSLLTMIRSGRHGTLLVLEQVRLAGGADDGPPPSPLRGTLAFHDVTFTYPESDEPVVHHLTVELPPDAWVGVSGPSGAGKSTVLDLALGLLAPTEGTITLDGAPLAGEMLRRWQAGIGYVPQDVVLIDDTVRRNVTLGRPDGLDSEEQVRHALERARLLDDVLAMPDGLDTVLGASRALSGGQRQRLGIARALLGDPLVLVLDEASSSLDLATDRAILQTIAELQPRPMILMISHRPESFERCTQILTLPAGTRDVR